MRALRGEESGTATLDVRMLALDGRETEVNMSAAPLRDGEGRVVGAVNVFRDQTERRRLEREREAARTDELAAHEASRRLEAFLATAAHDLRTPLTTTIGYLALAQRRTERLAAVVAQEKRADLAQQLEAVYDRLEEADQSAARLARLLSLLFDTAAVRSDKLELHRAPCDLAALVREQVDALRVAAPDRTITLRAPADDQPIPIAVDADRIGQVVTNYVTNALKYAPPDKPVEVSVAVRGDAAHGGRARVAVRDAGPGIPKPERARVWELFHRAPGVAAQSGAQGSMPNGASTRQGGSLGLGLHICKGIITAHGGWVGVTSAVGAGSTFWFTLPQSVSLPSQASAAAL